MISHNHKFIHYEVPKTGSTTIREALTPYYDQSSDPELVSRMAWRRVRGKDSTVPWKNGKRDHLAIPGLYRHMKPRGAEAYFKKIGWDYNSYYKFTFVRNTWDRVLSMYMYRCKRYKIVNEEFMKYSPHPRCSNDLYSLLIDPDPHKFRKYIKKLSHSIGSQLSYIQNVNYVGRTETLQQDFDVICDNIKIPQQHLKQINTTKHKPYVNYYDDHSRKLISDIFAEEIEYFNFKFEL